MMNDDSSILKDIGMERESAITLASRSRSDAMPTGNPFDSLLRTSLLRILHESLRAPSNPVSARSVKAIRDALREDALETALRGADRAWRCLPEDAPTFAPIYGRLLALEARDHNAALGLLRRAADFSHDPDVSALMIMALLQLQRPDEARHEFETALATYCIEPAGLLAHAGGEILRHGAIDTPGWIGRGPDLRFVGLLAAGAPNAVEVQIDGGALVEQSLPRLRRGGARTFHLDFPQCGIATRLDVTNHGNPLLGSGLLSRRDFNLDGRVSSRRRRILGWARIGWLPSRPVRLCIEDEGGRRAEVMTRLAARAGRRWPFNVDLRAQGLRGSRIQVTAQLPDGRWEPLPGAPLLLEPAIRMRGQKSAPLGTWCAGSVSPRQRRPMLRRARTTDIIIPVYGNREEALACIESVLATIDDTARVVVVDDASDDNTLTSALDRLEADGRIHLLRNEQNQGFVNSANRGMRLHPTNDAVLLNSDTRVFDDWLQRLRAAAYSDPNVGTVTPLSNSGSIASYPHRVGAVIGVEAAAALHALAASTTAAAPVEIPVGVGFCLYIRRDCLRDIGELDAVVFGKGYGEESDFCLRARRHGWSHRLAVDVFVYHAEGASFGSRRNALLDRSQRLLNLRHPGYDRFILSFLAQDPLLAIRRRLDERRLLAIEGRFVLLVTLALTGGVARFVTERCRELAARGLVPLVLRPAGPGNARRCELWTDAVELPNLRYDIPSDLSDLTALLSKLRLDAVEIQHFLHLDARVVEAVRALPVPYDIVVHDYSWICPRVTLIDGTDRYCGEPAVSVCQECVRRNGSNLGTAISVSALRTRSEAWLKGAREVTAPSTDTAERLVRYFADLTVQVRPHSGRVMPIPLAARTLRRKSFRIALIGAIGTHKGYRVLLDCARNARARKLPIEFVVIGHTEHDEPLLATGKVFVTGRYSEPEAPHLLQREQPDIVWLPSVWPETWCYALDYALAAGLPVVAFDIGAIAERLRAFGAGDLLPLDLKPSRINERLIELCRRTRHIDLTESDFFEANVPRLHDDATIARSDVGGMNMMKSSNGKVPHDVQGEGMSASLQVLPLPTGLYLFSVKSANPPTPSSGDQLSLPAVHVGLGPGVRSDQVEFIAGPTTHGAWLFSTGDILVTKVNGTGATLVLTSVRAPGGEVLSISVSRLDTLTDAATLATPITQPAPSKAPGPAAKKTNGNGAAPHPAKPVFQSADGELPLPVKIIAHIRSRGDMNFAHVPWAGRVAPGLWIESFSVRPLERFAASDIEYKGLTGSGFETPWLSDDKMCGTKGMATPLMGFALRLKPSSAAAAFDCEYSGYFHSGTTVGPLRNGAPCRSSVANDSLEGIQVRIVKRASIVLPEAGRKGARAPLGASKPLGNGNPRPAGSGKPAVPSKHGNLEKFPSPSNNNSQRGARPTGRPSARRP
jgi:GT2 family glycosyltransferase